MPIETATILESGDQPAKKLKMAEPALKFMKMSQNATAPTRGSERSAGYDLYRYISNFHIHLMTGS